jgi:hypothetical protein
VAEKVLCGTEMSDLEQGPGNSREQEFHLDSCMSESLPDRSGDP